MENYRNMSALKRTDLEILYPGTFPAEQVLMFHWNNQQKMYSDPKHHFH